MNSSLGLPSRTRRFVKACLKRNVISAVCFPEKKRLPAYLIADYRSLAQALNIPGLFIKEISYVNESWKIRGELYAK